MGLITKHCFLRSSMQCRWARISTIFLRSNGRKSSTLAPIILRPYQEQCLNACMDALESGSTRIGVSLPTGSGKTTVFITLLSRITPPPHNARATRSLIIVNSIELARQSAEQLKRLFPDWTVEIEQGSKHNATGFADVTVATYQTLSREKRLLKFEPEAMKAIIIDEAHHAAARSYRALLSRFHPEIKHPDKNIVQETPLYKTPVIGFSATFGRHDGLALGSVFERIVYHRDFLEMIKDQWLCDVRFTSVRANLNLKDVAINSANGDFNPTSLAEVINTEVMNDVIVKSWIDRASSRKSTLVFCVNVAHVKELTQTFRRYGVDARYLFAETPPAARKVLLDDFKAGAFPVLVNCAILTEGADVPNIDCVLVARPTRSRNIFAQMIGRGMRLSPQTGKENCRIIDFVDSNSRVNGVVTIPTLFGLDPSEIDVEDETPASLEQLVAVVEESRDSNSSDIKGNASLRIPIPSSILYTDHDDPFSVVVINNKPTHINALSPLSWVACGGGIYVIELLKRGFIRIEPNESQTHYIGKYTPSSWIPASEGSPYLKSRKIITANDLKEAVEGVDNYIRLHVFRNMPTSGLFRTAKWRSGEASEGQKKLVEKNWNKLGKDMTEEQQKEYLANLTKGDAATIITRLKHGSQGRLKKLAKKQLKEEQFVKKEELRRLREEVQVGPLYI